MVTFRNEGRFPIYSMWVYRPTTYCGLDNREREGPHKGAR